jgi:hypothetical protein
MAQISHPIQRSQFCLRLRARQIAEQNLNGFGESAWPNGLPDFSESANADSFLQRIASNLRKIQRQIFALY